MKALTLFAVGVALLSAAAAHAAAVYFGLDGGTPDWRIVALLCATTGAVYGFIRA